VIDDNYEPSSYFNTTVDLITSLTKRYSIDTRRLYTTGQSMGAMLSLGMGIKYPGLFAASLIVAGQWDPSEVAPLASSKLWIIVSEDDSYAYPTENEMMTVVEDDGAKVATAVWNGSSTAAQFAADVRSLEAAGDPINYAAFASGTLPTSGNSGGDSGHMDTWHVAYTIPGVRDWVMRQAL
jgi:predicted peptidase